MVSLNIQKNDYFSRGPQYRLQLYTSVTLVKERASNIGWDGVGIASGTQSGNKPARVWMIETRANLSTQIAVNENVFVGNLFKKANFYLFLSNWQLSYSIKNLQGKKCKAQNNWGSTHL